MPKRPNSVHNKFEMKSLFVGIMLLGVMSVALCSSEDNPEHELFYRRTVRRVYHDAQDSQDSQDEANHDYVGYGSTYGNYGNSGLYGGRRLIGSRTRYLGSQVVGRRVLGGSGLYGSRYSTGGLYGSTLGGSTLGGSTFGTSRVWRHDDQE